MAVQCVGRGPGDRVQSRGSLGESWQSEPLHLQQPWAAGMVQGPCFHMLRYQLDAKSWHLLPTPQHKQCLGLFGSLVCHRGVPAI